MSSQDGDDEADLLYLFRSALEPAYDVLAADSTASAGRISVEELGYSS